MTMLTFKELVIRSTTALNAQIHVRLVALNLASFKSNSYWKLDIVTSNLRAPTISAGTLGSAYWHKTKASHVRVT